MNFADRLERIPDRAAAWLGRRGPHDLPLPLTQGRIYVLPSGAGLAFGAALIVMLIGAINYNLSLGYGLVFLLVGAGLSATIQAFRNLLGLNIARLRIDPVFAGEAANLQVLIENPSSLRRPALRLRCGKSETRTTLEAATSADIELALPTTQRGWMPIKAIRIGTTWPLGLVRAWSMIRPDLNCLVYPAPESAPPPLPLGDSPEASGRVTHRSGDDDFAGLRAHRLTDSPGQIAWKAAASGAPLLTKEFSAQQGASLLLDWNALHGLDDEARAARLAAWALTAEARGLRYALRTPEGLLDAASGAPHLRTCLARLALARSRHEHA